MKEIILWFCVIFVIAIFLTVLSYEYCSEMRLPKECICETKKWVNKVKATMKDGTPIEIIVYDEPLSDGGFVINVHRNDDPLGKCWGTVIYPKPLIE